jgi:hypothetical protein
MSDKLYAKIAPLLAAAAFIALPATAQAAAPHWYRCHEVAAGTGKYQDAGCTKKATGDFELTRLPMETEKRTVSISGRLTLSSPTMSGLDCSVAGHGKIWNTNLSATGKGEVQGFEFYECEVSGCTKGIAVAPEGLPWSTELLTGPPVRFKMTGMEVRIKCEEPEFGVLYTGELTPEWINGDPSVVEFGSGSGVLSSGIGELTLTGTFSVVGEGGEVIDAIAP